MHKMGLSECGNLVTGHINRAFGSREPWQIATITATSVLSFVWLWNFIIDQDESIVTRGRKQFWMLARKFPGIKKQIDCEIEKVVEGFKNDTKNGNNGLPYFTDLPMVGLSREEIDKKVDQYMSLGHYKWQEGRVSGAVYYYDPKLVEMVTSVYGKASYTNPLHADVFPGVTKMEAEVIRMTANLFHGGRDSCGTMTTGGTESIIMACKAYRDYARETKGITRPNIVAPVTVHAAIDKAGQYLRMHVKSIRVDPTTTEVDISAMEKAINKNTVMLVGSAPNFPYGTMDDIEAIARLGKKYNIPVHVDACLGGFIIVFMNRAGYTVKPFDFSVDGVTSISADTHKYGFAPKGSSVILYSDPKFRRHQYTVTTDWPGGVYGSPSVNGSRAGGIIAACWATLLSFGEDGYTEATKKIIDTARYIERGLRGIQGIHVIGTPATTVVAIGSEVFDIFRLSTALCSLGWNLNALQFPSGIHLAVTFMHTYDGVADQFLKDVKESVDEMLLDPSVPVKGKMAIYGVAQALPDRSLVGDFTRCFLDAKYYTDFE